MNDHGDLAGASFAFNARCQKYWPYDGDNSVADAILRAETARALASSLIAEGGRGIHCITQQQPQTG